MTQPTSDLERVPPFASLPIDPALARDLRSDHAGEWGAVEIYRGVLATARDEEARRFAREHLETESRHRDFFHRWLPRRLHSRLLPLWRAAGWLLGAIAGVFGARGVYRTVAAVETFVERHYQEQISALEGRAELHDLRALLQSYCADEVAHRDEAHEASAGQSGSLAGLWATTVGGISAVGVAVARRV